MKKLFLLLLLIFCAVGPAAQAQTSTNTSFRFRSGASLPASCVPRDVFFRTSDALFYGCMTTNTWTPFSLTATGVSGSGTIGTIPRWTAGSTLGNSSITDNGTTATITSPKIITSILDTNGATWLGITPAATAVNSFTIANAASGSSPAITTTLGSGARFGGAPMITDAAAGAYQFQAQSAYSQATSNTTGASLTIAGGLGRRFYTSVSNTAGAVVVTTTVDGASVALTSGTDFNLGSDNTAPQLAITATNLAAAINANGTLNVKVTAVASAAIVYLNKLTTVISVTVATDQGARISATSGADGPVLLSRGATATPSLAFIDAPTTGFFWQSAGISMSHAAAGKLLFLSGGPQLLSTNTYQFSSGAIGAASDVIIGRDAAATLRLGVITSATAAVAQTLTVSGSSGNSAAPALWTIAGSDQSGTTTTGGGVKIRGGNGTSAGGAVEIWTSATTTPAVALSVGADKGITAVSLAGTGSRAVIADANGLLSAPVSDARLKLNVHPITESINVLDILPKINGVYFNYNQAKMVAEGRGDFGSQREIGLTYQNLKSAGLPELTGVQNGYGFIKYDQVTAFLIEVAKAQQLEIAALKARIEKMEAQR